VVDHGIEQGLLDEQRRECLAFFDRGPQSLVLSMVQGDQSRFAWLDYVPAPAGDNSLDSVSWSIGPINERGSLPWRPDTQAMQKTWNTYYSAVEQLVAILMQLLALALGLPAHVFDDALVGHRSSMRAILYPEVTELDLEAAGGFIVRSDEHTDWGCITVLLADEQVGGLEIRSKDGSWVPLDPVPGGLIVNLGDLMPYWTRGKVLATPHRVVARQASRARRLSIPYFGLVNRQTVIKPLTGPQEELLDACTADDKNASNVSDLPLMTAGEFFDRHEEYMRRWSPSIAK